MELGDQQAVRVAFDKRVEQPRVARHAPAERQGHVVEKLDRRGFRLQDGRHRRERLVETPEVQQRQARVFRHGHQIQGQVLDDGQGPFTATHQPRQVEARITRVVE